MGRELKVHVHPSRIQRWRHIVEIVAFIGAGLWAIYVFVYQERIKPESELPRFQSQLTVHHEKLSAQKEYVEVEIDLKNISGAKASLDGMIVNVYGRRMATTSSERAESPLAGITELNRTLTISAPMLLYSFYDTWNAFGAPGSKVAILEGGSDFRERLAFGITPRSFDMLKIMYTYCFSRPGSYRWPVHRARTSDGAYHFSGINFSKTPNLHCSGQRRGEYYAV